MRIFEEQGAVALQVAFGQCEISKPIYFVKENDVYKLNLLHPFVSSQYRIKNDHDQIHHVRCRGGSENKVKPGEDVYISCEDDCGDIWSGSWFEDVETGRRVRCDYNTVGWDVRFNEAGVIECHDDC